MSIKNKLVRRSDMIIKRCPHCYRLPKIVEGRARNSHRFYSIGCPNYCNVLKPQNNNYIHCTPSRCRIIINDDVDYNTIYKKWNEKLIEGSD